LRARRGVCADRGRHRPPPHHPRRARPRRRARARPDRGGARRRPQPGGGLVRRLPLEVPGIWLVFAVVAFEIAVTSSRLPARELYHVSGSGLEGGASRVLVFSNYPLALVAIAILALLLEGLGRLKVVAVAGIVLSAAVFWPG